MNSYHPNLVQVKFSMKYIYRFLNEQKFEYGEVSGSKLEEPDEKPIEESDDKNELIQSKKLNKKLNQTSITRLLSDVIELT